MNPGPASSTALLPAQIVAGPVIVVAATVIGTAAVPLFEQAPEVTVTLSVTLPPPPAVNVIDGVDAPPVIVPLVMLHAYVAPAVAATLAELFVLFAQTFGGVVRVVEGGVSTVTVVGAEVAEQLP